MTKNKRKNRFQSQGAEKTRIANNRREKQVKEELPLMLFSFKDFRGNQQGQTYTDWQKQELLASLMEKCGQICSYNQVEAKQQGFIKVYGEFPENSGFTNPFFESEVDWAVIMKVGGQKPRVVGYVDGHIFYVVFLDSEHEFYPSNKKHT